MEEDEPNELDELFDLALALTVIDATTLGRLASYLAHLGARLQVEFDRAGDAVLPGQRDFERLLLELRREISLLADSRRVPPPRMPAVGPEEVASLRLARLLGGVVEALAYLSVRLEFR